MPKFFLNKLDNFAVRSVFLELQKVSFLSEMMMMMMMIGVLGRVEFILSEISFCILAGRK